MSNNIIEFTGTTTLPIPPNNVLDGAKDKLENVLVIGWDEDDELYVASSDSKTSDILFLLKKAEILLMLGSDYAE